MQILEEHAAPGLSAKVKAVELISRASALNISSEVKWETEIKCPINTYIEPTYSLIFIFIVPFHLFPTLPLFPKHISLLGCENWASNLRRRQEMTYHLTAVSRARPGAQDRLIPVLGGKDNAYYLTIIQRCKIAGSCGA